MKRCRRPEVRQIHEPTSQSASDQEVVAPAQTRIRIAVQSPIMCSPARLARSCTPSAADYAKLALNANERINEDSQESP